MSYKVVPVTVPGAYIDPTWPLIVIVAQSGSLIVDGFEAVTVLYHVEFSPSSTAEIVVTTVTMLERAGLQPNITILATM